MRIYDRITRQYQKKVYDNHQKFYQKIIAHKRHPSSVGDHQYVELKNIFLKRDPTVIIKSSISVISDNEPEIKNLVKPVLRHNCPKILQFHPDRERLS